MNVMLKQEDVFAKTTLKASIVRGNLFFLWLYCVLSGLLFQVQKIPDFIFMCFRCKPGFFNLESSNPRGCTPCFCFGHSSVCTNAVGYSVYPITSTFQIGNLDLAFCLPVLQGWTWSFLKKISNFLRIFW